MSTAEKQNDADPVTEIAQWVMEITGVQLGARQRPMVESRLQRRMSELSMEDFYEYRDFVRANYNEEIHRLVSLLTTHHSYFFREYSHFEYLLREALPRLIETARKRGDRKLRVWSAACSRGQEVYSLSMFLHLHLKVMAPDLTYEILGTDIDAESVSVAENGVYHRNEIKDVPLMYLADHWAKGTGDIEDYVKTKASIGKACRFEVRNLTQANAAATDGPYDVIFCRNVFIYFTSRQIEEITQRLLKSLTKEGFLFIGISESLNGLQLPVRNCGPSVYSHPAAAPQFSPRTVPLRVLCVDDSSSIHALMKRILCREEGFEIVATAMNGLEAAQRIRAGGIDLVTLDIHMPEQDGVSYLEKNFGPSHPPVVVVSSVSRDDATLAFRAVSLGAADYVEKPALANLAERGEEIRTKLRCAFSMRGFRGTKPAMDPEFKKEPRPISPEGKVSVIVAGCGQLNPLLAFLKELKGTQPPAYILVEGALGVLPAFAKAIEAGSGRRTETQDLIGAKAGAGQLIVTDFRAFDRILELHRADLTSLLVFGDASKHALQKLTAQKKAQLLLDERGAKATDLRSMPDAADVVPTTSFAYLSTKFFEEKKNGI